VVPCWLPLHKVASNGSVEMAKWFLDQKFDLALQDSEGDTVLHVAACMGEDKIVLFLLDYVIIANI
jgi:ankyrin repeat protein